VKALPIAATSFAVALGLLGACSSESSGPAAASLDVSFSTSAGDDGAVLFTVLGGPVDSVEAPGYQLYSARLDAKTLRVVVVGNLSSGTIARIHIADERSLPQYSAVINQVAARGSYMQRDPVSYSLTVVR
jgi:hypothetical protein